MVPQKTSKWEGGALNQYKAAIIGSLCYTIVGTATAWPSPILTKMRDNKTPLVLDVHQTSWMVSLMFLGHVISPIPSGYMMERYGCKRTCLCLSSLPFISWLLILTADTPVSLYIARFAAGIWMGVVFTILPIYVGEIAGPKLRSSLTTINNLLFNFGTLFVYIIGPQVNYYTLAIVCEILIVVYFCTFITMPESPHYLLKRKQREKAFEALNWLRKGEPIESIESEINRIEQGIEDQKHIKGSLKDIFFDAGNRKAFTISIVYAILKRLSGSGAMRAYTSITLPKVTLGSIDADSCVIIIGCVGLLSCVASTGLSVRYNRRILLTISCGGCAITLAIIMTWFYLDYYKLVDVTQFSDIVFWSIFLYFSVFNIGFGPIGTSIRGEIFSGNVKGLSSSLTTLVVAFMAFLVNKYYLIIAQSMGMYVNYLIFSVSSVVAIVFTWTYVPDTHNKTLEEIREILSGNAKCKNIV